MQPCPTPDPVKVQCSLIAFALSGGGSDLYSAQLYNAVAQKIIDKLELEDRRKLLVVTVPLSIAGKSRGQWLLKMSATVAYVLHEDPALAATLRKKLFGEAKSVTAFGLTLSVHASMEEVLTFRPTDKSLNPAPVTIITGLSPTATASQVIATLEETGALRMCGNNAVAQVRTTGRKEQPVLSILVTGEISTTPIRPMDVRYRPVSSYGNREASEFEIKVTRHPELAGQRALREQHKKQIPSTEPSDAVTVTKPAATVSQKVTPAKTPPAGEKKIAWATPPGSSSLIVPIVPPGSIVPVNPYGPSAAFGPSVQSTAMQLTSQALSVQNARISALETSIAEIKATALTKDSINDTMWDVMTRFDEEKEAKRKAARELAQAEAKEVKEKKQTPGKRTPVKNGGN